MENENIITVTPKVFKIEDYKSDYNYAIEASAGTGKTYTIKEIVAKLVTDKNNPIDLNKILIVTYTNKAAGELKDRIRSKLAELGIAQKFDFENAPIYTIHSFCNNVIKEYNIEMKKPLELDMVAEEESERFIDDYIRRDNIKNEFKCYNVDIVRKVKEYLTRAIKDYYLDKNYNVDSSIISCPINPDEKKILYKNKNEFLNNFPEYYDAIDLIDQVLAGGVLSSERQIRIREFKDTLEDNINKIDLENRFGYNGNKFQAKKGDPDLLVQAFGILKTIKEYGHNDIPNVLFKSKIKEVYTEWQLYKEKIKAETISDLVRYVREEILNNNDLLKKLREKYIYGIIDEFQDTNQLQWDIFRKIFMTDKNHIIVVGDPKQSIYSFQGADVEVYKSAVREISQGPKGIVASLTTNWRSTSDMIQACNKIFEFKDFFVDKGIIFTGSKSPSNNQKKIEYNGKDCKPIWMLENTTPSEFADAAVRTIINFTKETNGLTAIRITEEVEKELIINNSILIKKEYVTRNISFKDFAILARSRSEMSSIEYSLKKYGVPYVKYKDKGLFSSLECAHWKALLEAINTTNLTGNNIKYFKRALFTRFFNKTLKETNYDIYNTDSSQEIKLIMSWKEIARNRQWEDLIDRIIIDSKVIDRMSNTQELDTFSKIRQIGDFLIEYLTNNHSLEDAIDYLDKKINKYGDTDEEEEDNLVEKKTNFDCVKLMTIHASKGLEFPIVISVTGDSGPSNNYPAVYRDNNGQKVLGFDKELYGNQQYAEWMRLFYVDFTRAGYLLILPHYKDPKSSPNKKLNSAVKNFYDNHKNWYEIIEALGTDDDYKKDVEIILSKMNNSNKQTDNNREQRINNAISGIKNSTSYKHSYSSLSHSAHKEENTGDSDNADKEREVTEALYDYDINAKKIELDYVEKSIIISSSFPKGANVGTTLHEIFEKYDFTDTDDNTLRKLVEERFIQNGIISKPEWIDDSIRMTRNVLGANFKDTVNNEIFKLKEIPDNDKLAEVEYNTNILNGKLKNYINGFIDLVFRRNDRYYIIDWKSDSINEEEFKNYYEYDSLKSHVDKLYSIQRVLYSYILINWIAETEGISQEEVFNNKFGGIYYVFLRGCVEDTSNGIYAHNWDTYKQLEDAYNKIIKDRIKK